MDIALFDFTFEQVSNSWLTLASHEYFVDFLLLFSTMFSIVAGKSLANLSCSLF